MRFLNGWNLKNLVSNPIGILQIHVFSHNRDFDLVSNPIGILQILDFLLGDERELSFKSHRDTSNNNGAIQLSEHFFVSNPIGILQISRAF